MTLRALPIAVALLALAAPGATAATLVSTTIAPGAATAGSCLSRTGGDGVVQRRVMTHADGLVQARLSAPAGDWDVGVFDATGRLVAGSAHYGGTELAEGFVRAGQELLVQACRRAGTAGAQLSVRNVALPAAAPGALQLVRVHVPTAAAKDLLMSLDLDMTEHGREGFLDVLLHGDEDAAALTGAGLRYDVLLDDVAAADREAVRATSGPPDGTMPSGRVAYRRLPEFSEDMKKLVDENPGLVKPITLAHPTLEGRPVEGLEISDDVDAADGKPVFLMVGVHHAREWPSAELTLEFAFEMVNTFKSGSERTVGLLEKARVIVVPVVNPDGFNLSREEVVDGGSVRTDVGFAYKRKNCRVADDALPAAGECGLAENRDKGVDPNRNYGGFWGGPGASTSPTSDTYRGMRPFSEPETANIQQLVSSRQVTTLITNHTYADLILRAPGLASSPTPPDDALLKELADAMAVENGYTSQRGFELYDTTGTTEDWSYFATGGLGYTFEIGRYDNLGGGGALTGAGFHPPYPSVVLEWFGKHPTGGGNREAFYLALESTANEARHAVITGKGRPGATIRVRKSFVSRTSGGEDGPISYEERLDSRMTIPASGAFEYHVNQSTRPIVVIDGGTEAWTLTCEDAAGTVLGQADVVIARGERKDVGSVCEGASAPPAAAGLALKVAARRTSLRTLLRKGLTVKVTCSSRCDLSARLLRGKRRVGSAARRGVTVATLRVKLTRSAARRLRRSRRVTLRLRVAARAGGASRTAIKTLKLKR